MIFAFPFSSLITGEQSMVVRTLSAISKRIDEDERVRDVTWFSVFSITLMERESERREEPGDETVIVASPIFLAFIVAFAPSPVISAISGSEESQEKAIESSSPPGIESTLTGRVEPGERRTEALERTIPRALVTAEIAFAPTVTVAELFIFPYSAETMKVPEEMGCNVIELPSVSILAILLSS